MEKSVTFTGACANYTIPGGKAEGGGYVRIHDNLPMVTLIWSFIRQCRGQISLMGCEVLTYLSSHVIFITCDIDVNFI